MWASLLQTFFYTNLIGESSITLPNHQKVGIEQTFGCLDLSAYGLNGKANANPKELGSKSLFKEESGGCCKHINISSLQFLYLLHSYHCPFLYFIIIK